MKPLELLELANKAYPDDGLRDWYRTEDDVLEVAKLLGVVPDVLDLYNGEGDGDPLADAIVRSLLDVCKEIPPGQTERQMLFQAAERMEQLQRTIGLVRNAIVDYIVREVDHANPTP